MVALVAANSLSTTKTNVTIQGDKNVFVEYWTTRKKDESTGEIEYEFHGNCYGDGLDANKFSYSTTFECLIGFYNVSTNIDWIMLSVQTKSKTDQS